MMHENRRVFRIAIAAADAAAFLQACDRTQWEAVDTGERIMTEEGPDGEAILLVEPEVVTRTQGPVLAAQ